MARLFTGRETVDNWHPLDGPAPEFIPLQWTGPHVAVRLTDAWKTLQKMPWRSPVPRSYGRWWPHYKIEWYDLNAMGADEVQAMQREANRVRVLPSARDISQMEAALMWPMEYLAEPRQVLIVNVVSRVTSFDGDLAREIRRRNYTGDADEWRATHWRCCDAIADRLIDDRVMVF